MSVTVDAVDVRLSATGAETTLAQLAAVRTAMQAMQGQTATLKMDTSGVKTAASEVGALGTAHQGLGKTATTLKMDVSQVEGARTSVKNLDNDLLSLASTAGKVGPVLAAAFAGGALTKFASDYQTLLVTTANNTTLTTADLATLDKTIRNLPSGSAPLTDLATGLKNITDLGYSAADAQKMANEESRAATESGANQATVMLSVTSAMKEYNATADEVAKYTNIVAESAKLANSTMQAWTEGTRQGTAVAAAYGVTLQEADAFMVALTRHGFSPDEVSTQLRGVVQHIANPSPQAEAELKRLQDQTGVPLVADFTPQALDMQKGGKGLAAILGDVKVATADDTAEVTKLIPALRGGQGAMIVVTQAAGDMKSALVDIGGAADGSLTPVEDGFARIQQTAGYQFGQTMKQVKFDLIDVGQAGLPAVTALAEGFGKIPAPVIESAVRLAEVALAVKSVTAVGGLLTSTWAKMTAATTTATAASATEATTTTAAADGTTALTAALTANTEAVLANTAAKGEQALATAELTATAPLATVAVDGQTAALAAETAATEANTAAKLANNASRTAGNLLAMAGPAIAVGEGINAYSGVFGDLKNGDIKQAFGDFIKNEPASPQGLLSLASNVFGFSNPLNNLPFWRQSKAAAPGSTDAGTSGAPTDAGADPFGLIANTQPSDAEIQAMTDHYDMLAAKRDALLAKGAPEALVNHALYPEDFGESKAQLAQYTKDLALWQQQYDATKSAATAAATELGKVDVSKGIASLAASATGLEKVRAGLAKVGQSNDALNTLTSIAKRFDDIATATDAASASYDGYTALLTNTNTYETKLDNYKKEVDASVAAAQAAVANGTATPDQVELLKDAPNIYGNIAQSLAQLDAHKAGDVLSIAKDMPDWVRADSLTRTTAENLGGIKAVDISVSTEKDAATTALEDLVNNPHVVTVHVQTVNDTPASTSASGGRTYGPGDVVPFPGAAAATTPPGGWGYQNLGPQAPGYTPSGGGFNQFRPLSQPDYLSIVRSSEAGKSNGPFEDPAIYAAVMQAAQQYGVDPRALLAFTKNENNDAINIAPDLNAANNFAGIKYVGQAGASKGPVSSEGDNYAAFNSPEDFFAALARNLSTGVYADAYKKGDLAAVRQEYVVGGAGPGSPQQQQNIANTVGDYNAWAQRYPAAGGGAQTYSAAANAAQGYGPGTYSATGGTGNLTTASDDAVRQQIVAKAMQAVGDPAMSTALAGWCEQFVEDTLQAITGTRGPSPGATDANAALASDKAQGLQTFNPKPGDLVYYGDDKQGHVAIYAGNGQQISTADVGGSQIHVENVGPGAQYISSIGRPSASPAVGYGPGTYSSTGGTAVGKVNYTQPPGSAYQTRDLTAQFGSVIGVLTGIVKDLGGKAAADLSGFMDQTLAASTRLITQQTKGVNPDGSLNADQKKSVDAAATARTLDVTVAIGTAMRDIENHTGNVAADMDRIRTAGGALGDNLAQQVSLWGQIQDATAKVAADQAAVTTLDLANTQRKQREAADDQAASRAKTRDGWTTAENDAQIARYQQGIQAGWQREQVIQAAKQTASDRAYQDATTQEDRSHTVTMRNLDDQLKSMQKLQTTANSGNSATEQNLLVASTGPGDLQTKFGAAEQLAIQKDFDSRNRQNLTDQIAAITDAQVAENRLYEDDKYNRDRAHTTATRNFQDEATQAANNHTAVTNQWASEAFQRAETARQQTTDDTEAQWRLQDLRAGKDAQYTTDKAAADATLKGDQDHAKALGEQATATADALKTWGKIADLVGTAGNGLLSVLPALAALAGSGGGLSPSDISQITGIIDARTGSYSRRLGGADGVARGA